MRVTAYGLFVNAAALLILIGSVLVLLADNMELNNSINDQSYTIKTIMQDYEQANETCKGHG